MTDRPEDKSQYVIIDCTDWFSDSPLPQYMIDYKEAIKFILRWNRYNQSLTIPFWLL